MRVTHSVSVNDNLLGHLAIVATHKHLEQACTQMIQGRKITEIEDREGELVIYQKDVWK